MLASGRDILRQPWPGAWLFVEQISGRAGQSRQFVAYSRMHTRLSHRMRATILLAVQLVLSLLLIGLVGWWLARGVAKPVDALRNATRRMAAGELSARVGKQWEASRDELGQLARDFNGMAGRIEALVAHDRGVLQDLSHELRSPLARLQIILDLAQHSPDAHSAANHFRQAESEIERLDRMTGEMLALARLKGDLPGMERDPLDVGELAGQCVVTMQLAAAARDVRLDLNATSSVIVLGSATLLRRAIDNLLANAIKDSPRNGRVEIGVRATKDSALVEVRDHGPGVPEQELERLFRPFYRGSNAARAEGHGLGLTVVQRVAKAHGGDVEAGNEPGGGLRVVFRVPRAVDTVDELPVAGSSEI
ncbi:MAG: ATP-binding protein, partial [Rhodanobacteraceae bacterium]